MGSCCSGSKKKKKDRRRDEDEDNDESVSTDSQDDKFDCVTPPDEIDIKGNSEEEEEEVKNEKVTEVKTKVIDKIEQAQVKQVHNSTETKMESSSNEHPAATPLNQAHLRQTSATSDKVSQEEQKVKSPLQSLHRSLPPASTGCGRPKPDKVTTDEKKAEVLEIAKHIESAVPVLPASTGSKRAELKSPVPKATITSDYKADREMTTGDKKANVIEIPKPLASAAPVLPASTGSMGAELKRPVPKATITSDDKADREMTTGDKKANVIEIPKPLASATPVLLPTGFKRNELKNPASEMASTMNDYKEMTIGDKKANVIEVPKPIASPAPVLLPTPTEFKRTELEGHAPKATGISNDTKERKSDKEVTTGDKKTNVLETSKPEVALPVPSALPKTSISSSHYKSEHNGNAKPKPKASPAPVLLAIPTGFKPTEHKNPAPKNSSTSNENKEVTTGDKKTNVLETSKPKVTLPVPSALPKTSISSSHDKSEHNGNAKLKPKSSPQEEEVTTGDKKVILLEIPKTAPVLSSPTGFKRTQLKSPVPKMTITSDVKADREMTTGEKEANHHQVSKPISSDLPVPSASQRFLSPKTNISSNETSETINDEAKPKPRESPAPALLPTPTGFKSTELQSIVPKMTCTSNDSKEGKSDKEVTTDGKKANVLETSKPKSSLPVPIVPPKTNISSSHETNEVNDESKKSKNVSEIETDKSALSDTQVEKSTNMVKSIPEPSSSTPAPTGPPISLATPRPKSAGIKTSPSKPKSLPRPRSILPTRGMQIHKSPASTNALKSLIEKSKIMINAPKSAGHRSTTTAPPTLHPESESKSIEQEILIPNVPSNERTDKLVIETKSDVVDSPGAKTSGTKLDESNNTVEVADEDKVKSPEQKEIDECASKLAPKLPSLETPKSPVPKSNASELACPGQKSFLPAPNRSKLFIPIKPKCPISNANALSELDKKEDNDDEKCQDPKTSSSPVLLPASKTSNVASKATGALPHLSMLPSSFSVTIPSQKSSTASQLLPLPTKVNKPTPTGLPVPLKPPTFLPKSSKTQNALSGLQSAVNDEHKTGTLPKPNRAPVLLPSTAGPKSSLPLPASTGLPCPPMALPSVGSGGSKTGSKATELPQSKESSGESDPAQNDDVVKDYKLKSKKPQKKPSSKSSTKSSSKKNKATKPSSKSSTKSKKPKSSKTQSKKPTSKSSVKSHKAGKSVLTTKKPSSKSSERKSKTKSKSASSNGSQKAKPRSKPKETTEQKCKSSSNKGGNQSDEMH